MTGILLRGLCDHGMRLARRRCGKVRAVAAIIALVASPALADPPVGPAQPTLCAPSQRLNAVAWTWRRSSINRRTGRTTLAGATRPPTYLAHAGIRVLIDDEPAIAHNKVIVIDGRTVLTGSFNFTLSADTRNAENVVVLESANVAGWFLANWRAREAVSRVFEAQ